MNDEVRPAYNGYTVLFCDENIVAVNKQSGIAVIPARGESPLLSLKKILENELHCTLFTVHRIDKGTSGVVVFAKNAHYHRLLNRQFEKRTIKKQYLALVQGCMKQGMVCCEPIKMFGSGRMGVHPEGKPSETRIEVVDASSAVSLARVFPVTGRRHQIRVHLYHCGYPIVGDDRYGRERPVLGGKRLMLHAESLTVAYPGDTPCHFSAPVDEIWADELKRYTGNYDG